MIYHLIVIDSSAGSEKLCNFVDAAKEKVAKDWKNVREKTCRNFSDENRAETEDLWKKLKLMRIFWEIFSAFSTREFAERTRKIYLSWEN